MTYHSHFHNLMIASKPLTLVLVSITFANVNSILTLIGLTISILYGIRKWWFLEKQNKQIKENEKDININ